jgi:hypothetical protein
LKLSLAYPITAQAIRLPELPVIQECKPLLQSLDPTEVAREQKAIQEKAIHSTSFGYK